MRFFFAALRLHLARLLRQPAVAACLLALPALALALGLLLGGDSAAPTRVGVVLPGLAQPAGSAEGRRAAQLWQALEAASGEALEFILAEDAAALEERVAAGVWDCGYLLPADLDARITAGHYARLVTRVDGPASTLASLADWPVEAALLQACAPDIALAYAGRSGLLEGLTAEQIRAARQAAFGAQQPMVVRTVDASAAAAAEGAAKTNTGEVTEGTAAGTAAAKPTRLNPAGRSTPTQAGQNTAAATSGAAATKPANPTQANPGISVQTSQNIQTNSGQAAPTQAAQNAAAMVRGLIALLLLLLACLCSAHLAQDAPALARLRPLRPPAALLLPAYAALALLAGLAGGAALAVMGALIPGSLARPGLQAAALALYLPALCAFAFLLAGLLPGRRALACALPLLMVACLVFCPIFFNLALIFPAAGALAALLPPTLYLRAAAGSPGALWQLALMAALYAAPGALLAARRKPRPENAA